MGYYAAVDQRYYRYSYMTCNLLMMPMPPCLTTRSDLAQRRTDDGKTFTAPRAAPRGTHAYLARYAARTALQHCRHSAIAIAT